MPEEEFPPIPAELLKALQERFPDQCPSLAMTHREVWYKAGQRSVVAFLESTFEDQTTDHKVLKGN